MLTVDPASHPTPFSVELDSVEPTARLRLVGELDADGAALLRRQLDELPLDAPITLDLADLAFVDSVGVGVLLRLQRRVADAGHLLVATGASPGVRRTFEVAGLHRVIALVDEAG